MDIFYILASERDRFDDAYSKFLYELIWCSNCLDGFTITELKTFIKKLSNNKVFQTEMVQKLCDMIDCEMSKEFNGNE